jgi:hypothetical protein
MDFPLFRFLAEGHKAVKKYFGSKKRGFYVTLQGRGAGGKGSLG